MSTASILTRALRLGIVIAVGVAVLAGGLGWMLRGAPGLLGGLVGAGLAAVFLGLTTVSMLIAGRVTRGKPGDPVFFAIVLGAWVLKLVVFVIAAIVLRGISAVDPYVFFWAIMATVVGSLAADIVALVSTRVPYVSDVVLPGETGSSQQPEGPRPPGARSGNP